MDSLEKALQDTSHERDRALQNLSPLKQHLLEKVLDLMVRMLGFSEEDNQKIGSAQSNAGKGGVRGVGGIVGGNSAGHLLMHLRITKSTEEREKQEASEAAARLSEEENRSASTSNAASSQPSQHPSNVAPGPSTKSHQLGRPESEFGTVPLEPSTYTSTQQPYSRPPLR